MGIILLAESIVPRDKAYVVYSYDDVVNSNESDISKVRDALDKEKGLKADYVMGDMTGASDVLVFKGNNGSIEAVVFVNAVSKELMLLYVMSKHRHKGVGKGVLNTLVGNNVIDNLQCSVWNADAMVPYIKAGFVISGMYGSDYVNMKLHSQKFIASKRGY